MRKQYDIRPSGLSEEAFLVDEAQIEILRFAKHAAEQMMSDRAFFEGVQRIIKVLTDNLTSEALIVRCRAILPNYAMRMLLRERKFVETYALWYVYALTAKRKKLNGSANAYALVEQMISPELRKTPLFKAAVLNIPDQAYNWAVPLEQWQRNYTKTIKDLTEELIYSDAKEDYSTNVNLRNIAEMTVRYEHQVEMINDLKANGVKLVWIEPHANCSERCEKYQGKLYSLDGTFGKIDGNSYRPLEYATNNPSDIYITKAGRIYQNGCITGFNCRHQLLPYEKGNRPMEIPADVIARRRAIEERQRAMERAIRAKKREAILLRNVDPEKAKKAREAASRMNERYQVFSQKNNAPFHKERLSLFYDEQNRLIFENSEHNSTSRSLTNTENRDIINISGMQIGRSVGAKAKNYAVELPNKELTQLSEGSRVTHIEVIAGKGRKRQIDEVDILVKNYGGSALEWQKKKGLGFVDYNGESYRVELHWYEEPTVGKHKWKVKPDKDGNWFIEDDK